MGQLIYKGKYGSIKKNMTDGGENCQVKVPAVLLSEMTSAYIQVLLRFKGKPKFPSSSVHESS